MTKDDQACIDLITLIVTQAIEDYKYSFNKINLTVNNQKDFLRLKSLKKEKIRLRNQCLEFFNSDYFNYLCDICNLSKYLILKKIKNIKEKNENK